MMLHDLYGRVVAKGDFGAVKNVDVCKLLAR